MKNQYKDVVEFFPFDNDELQEYINKAEQAYYNSIESLDNKLAANIQLMKAPLVVQLPELFKLHDQGYTVRSDRFCGVSGAGIDVTLIKSQAMIDADLALVHARAEEEYEAARFERNLAEQERQIAITLDRQRREREAAQKAAEQAEIAAQREQALAELIAAYAA